PPGVPRGGALRELRALVRKLILRIMRPYTNYQEKLNLAVVAALHELHREIRSDVEKARQETATERAQLLAELRHARQLRDAIEVQARATEELRQELSARRGPSQ